MKWGHFALNFRWPDLASEVSVVSVKSGPISVRSQVRRIERSLKKSGIFPLFDKSPTKNNTKTEH